MDLAARNSILSVTACVAGNFLLRAASSASLTLLSLYLAQLSRQEEAVRATYVGLLAIAFYTSELIGSPLFGSLSDRFGRRPFMFLGVFCGALGALALAVSNARFLFVLSRGVQGLSAASSVPAVLGHLAAVTAHSAQFRGRVMVAFEALTVLGFALGFASGGILWDRMGAEGFYAVLLLYALAAGAFALIQEAPTVAPARAGALAYIYLFRNRAILAFIPAWVSVNAVLGMWFTHLGFQMARSAEPGQLLVGGYSGSSVGLLSAGVSLVLVVGAGFWALAFGRIKTFSIMALTLWGLAALCVLLYLLNHVSRGDTVPIVVFASLGVVALLVVSGFTPAALTYLADLSEHFPEYRGSVMGLYSVFLGVGQLLGAGVGGFFAQNWHVDGLILGSALWGVIANVSLYFVANSSGSPAGGQRADGAHSPPSDGPENHSSG